MKCIRFNAICFILCCKQDYGEMVKDVGFGAWET